MRIRSIKPEFWRSSDISALDWETRLLFIGLWSYVDDNGVGVDREALIAADLFPDDLARDTREILATVSRGLQTLFERGQIVRYSVGNKRFLEIANWKRHQKIDHPNKERYPASTSENAAVTTDYTTPSRDSRETLAPGTEEQRNRGTEEQRNRGTEEQQTCATPSRSSPLRFDEFWKTYPRRRDRRKAEKAFANALNRADADTIIAGAVRYANDPNRLDQFTKYGEGWLNGDGWLDEPLPSRTNGSNVTAFERKKAHNAAVFASLADPVQQELS